MLNAHSKSYRISYKTVKQTKNKNELKFNNSNIILISERIKLRYTTKQMHQESFSIVFRHKNFPIYQNYDNIIKSIVLRESIKYF